MRIVRVYKPDLYEMGIPGGDYACGIGGGHAPGNARGGRQGRTKGIVPGDAGPGQGCAKGNPTGLQMWRGKRIFVKMTT